MTLSLATCVAFVDDVCIELVCRHLYYIVYVKTSIAGMVEIKHPVESELWLGMSSLSHQVKGETSFFQQLNGGVEIL